MPFKTLALYLLAFLLFILPFLFSTDSTKYLLELRQIRSSTHIKIVFSLFLIIISLYLLFDYTYYKNTDLQEKYFAKRISISEYQSQSSNYTKSKLAELYQSKDYQNYLKIHPIHNTQTNNFSEDSENDL